MFSLKIVRLTAERKKNSTDLSAASAAFSISDSPSSFQNQVFRLPTDPRSSAHIPPAWTLSCAWWKAETKLYNSKRKLNVLEECNMSSKPSKGTPPCRPQTFSSSSSRQPPSPLFSSAREIRKRQSSPTPQFWIGPSRFPQNRTASFELEVLWFDLLAISFSHLFIL